MPGHWEIDTIVGPGTGRHSILTLVERMTGYVVMGRIERHTAAECAAKVIELIRPYLPKKTSLAKVTRADCGEIAAKLSARPRKRHAFKTPEECYVRAW